METDLKTPRAKLRQTATQRRPHYPTGPLRRIQEFGRRWPNGKIVFIPRNNTPPSKRYYHEAQCFVFCISHCEHSGCFQNRLLSWWARLGSIHILRLTLPALSSQSATLPARVRGSSAPSTVLQEKMDELKLNKDKRKEPDWSSLCKWPRVCVCGGTVKYTGQNRLKNVSSSFSPTVLFYCLQQIVLDVH